MGEEKVGTRVEVFWKDCNEWFQGQVKAYDPEKGYYIVYEDGDENWEHVYSEEEEEIIRFLEDLDDDDDGNTKETLEVILPPASPETSDDDDDEDEDDREQTNEVNKELEQEEQMDEKEEEEEEEEEEAMDHSCDVESVMTEVPVMHDVEEESMHQIHDVNEDVSDQLLKAGKGILYGKIISAHDLPCMNDKMSPFIKVAFVDAGPENIMLRCKHVLYTTPTIEGSSNPSWDHEEEEEAQNNFRVEVVPPRMNNKFMWQNLRGDLLFTVYNADGQTSRNEFVGQAILPLQEIIRNFSIRPSNTTTSMLSELALQTRTGKPIDRTASAEILVSLTLHLIDNESKSSSSVFVASSTSHGTSSTNKAQTMTDVSHRHRHRHRHHGDDEKDENCQPLPNSFKPLKAEPKTTTTTTTTTLRPCSTVKNVVKNTKTKVILSGYFAHKKLLEKQIEEENELILKRRKEQIKRREILKRNEEKKNAIKNATKKKSTAEIHRKIRLEKIQEENKAMEKRLGEKKKQKKQKKIGDNGGDGHDGDDNNSTRKHTGSESSINSSRCNNHSNHSNHSSSSSSSRNNSRQKMTKLVFEEGDEEFIRDRREMLAVEKDYLATKAQEKYCEQNDLVEQITCLQEEIAQFKKKKITFNTLFFKLETKNKKDFHLRESLQKALIKTNNKKSNYDVSTITTLEEEKVLLLPSIPPRFAREVQFLEKERDLLVQENKKLTKMLTKQQENYLSLVEIYKKKQQKIEFAKKYQQFKIAFIKNPSETRLEEPEMYQIHQAHQEINDLQLAIQILKEKIQLIPIQPTGNIIFSPKNSIKITSTMIDQIETYLSSKITKKQMKNATLESEIDHLRNEINLLEKSEMIQKLQKQIQILQQVLFCCEHETKQLKNIQKEANIITEQIAMDFEKKLFQEQTETEIFLKLKK